MLPRANLLAPAQGSGGQLGKPTSVGSGVLNPLKLVRQSRPAGSGSDVATETRTTKPQQQEEQSSSKEDEKSEGGDEMVDTESTTPAALGQSRKGLQLQELLALVRDRSTQPTAPEAAVGDTSTASAASPVPESVNPSTVSPPVAASTAAAAAAAAASSSSFADAAAEARVDKLAILMSLFKSRGIQPPPLPLFDKLDGEQKSIGETLKPTRSAISTPLGSALTPVAAPPASTPAPAPAAPAATAASTPLASDDSPTVTAEIGQLFTLFRHARTKITKVCRLYQSGVLSGAAAVQAMEKLSNLIRAYYGFIQQAKSHTYIDRMDDDIRADVKCASLQELADRMYALART